jgi:glycosylphosphatidylinositol transamidase
MQADRFVSIGTYLPSAMLVAVNFTIMAIFLWVKSGSPIEKSSKVGSTIEGGEKQALAVVQDGSAKALVPAENLAVRERELFLPLAVVAGSQFLGVLPLYIFNHTSRAVSPIPPFLLLLMILTYPRCSTQSSPHSRVSTASSPSSSQAS